MHQDFGSISHQRIPLHNCSLAWADKSLSTRHQIRISVSCFAHPCIRTILSVKRVHYLIKLFKNGYHEIRATLFLPTTVHSFRILILKACMYTSAKTVQHQVAMTSRCSFMKLCSPATMIDCKVLGNKSWCN